MNQLAVFGGKPVRKDKICYGGQWVEDDDIKAVEDVLRSDLITCGPKVEEAERLLCKYTGAKHAVLVNSGTSALHCACIAAGIGAGDELITSPLTFAASANCAFYCGARPVFADIDPLTYNIDPVSVANNITDKTKAVVAVDFSGQVVKADEIRELCCQHNLVFIEDSAHSIGSEYKGHKVGTIADMTCFSFHPVKTVTSGEGGAILTDNDDFYQKLMLAHTHGITRDVRLMGDFSYEGPWCYEMISLGFNYRMTDFQAALLISQLKKIEKFKERRTEIVKRYNEAFASVPGIIVQNQIPESDTCRHLYIIRIDENILNCSRKQFFEALSAEGIQPQVHYVPVYWFQYYKKLGYKRGLCPNAEEVYRNIMSIPLYPKMTDRDVEDVINAVMKVSEYYRK